MDPISIALGLAQFAPSIMRFFGVGEKPVAVAERIVGIAAGVTGAKTPEEALAAMRENAQLAAQFNLAVLAADGDLEKACLADRASARERDTKIIQATGHNYRGDALAFLAIGGLLATGVALFIFNVPADSREYLIYILGALTVIAKDVYSFEFGSSRGSKDKDTLLAEKRVG